MWKEDTDAFNENEKKKQQYLKDVYTEHEQVLLAQMKDKQDKANKKKMTTLDLLFNKALMQKAATENENVKRAKV